MGVAASPFQQPARLQVKRRPLADAFRELVEGRPVRVVLDTERLGDKGSAVVTADLERVSLQNAIRILADMVDLSPVFLDQVAYITTREKARALHKELVGNYLDAVAPPGTKDEGKK
jgi:hypothetical protein